jgi:hypothetical protein
LTIREQAELHEKKRKLSTQTQAANNTKINTKAITKTITKVIAIGNTNKFSLRYNFFTSTHETKIRSYKSKTIKNSRAFCYEKHRDRTSKKIKIHLSKDPDS